MSIKILTIFPLFGVKHISSVCVASGGNILMAFNIKNGPVVSKTDDFNFISVKELVHFMRINEFFLSFRISSESPLTNLAKIF